MLDHQTTAALALCCVHLRDELKLEHHRRRCQKIEFLRQAHKEATAANRKLRAEAVQLGLRLRESRDLAESYAKALIAIQQLAEKTHMCALPNPQP